MAATYGSRPSEILGVEDPYAAFQVDTAVLGFGSWVEARLEERDKKGRPTWTLAALLEPAKREGEDAKAPRPRAGGFRSLAGKARKAKIGPDGTW
jgi:hypothetical protein